MPSKQTKINTSKWREELRPIFASLSSFVSLGVFILEIAFFKERGLVSRGCRERPLTASDRKSEKSFILPQSRARLLYCSISAWWSTPVIPTHWNGEWNFLDTDISFTFYLTEWYIDGFKIHGSYFLQFLRSYYTFLFENLIMNMSKYEEGEGVGGREFCGLTVH